jgi:hypothetical protein
MGHQQYSINSKGDHHELPSVMNHTSCEKLPTAKAHKNLCIESAVVPCFNHIYKLRVRLNLKNQVFQYQMPYDQFCSARLL